MTDRSEELVTAMIAAMRADATLNGIVARRVYSGDVPPEEADPFIVLGDVRIRDEGTIGTDNVGVVVPIHFVDNSLDTQRAYQVQKRLDALFHNPASLSLSAGSVVYIRRSEPRNVSRDQNERRIFAVATYDAFLCP